MIKPAGYLVYGLRAAGGHKPLVGAVKPQAPMAARSSDGWAPKSGLAIVAPPTVRPVSEMLRT